MLLPQRKLKLYGNDSRWTSYVVIRHTQVQRETFLEGLNSCKAAAQILQECLPLEGDPNRSYVVTPTGGRTPTSQEGDVGRRPRRRPRREGSCHPNRRETSQDREDSYVVTPTGPAGDVSGGSEQRAEHGRGA